MDEEKQAHGILDGYLKPEALAAELGIHVRTLRKLDERNEGPPRTIIGHKAIYYKKESVLEWLQSREQPKASKGRK
jgi:predicted DNA-binding transcriptional regulator AlpA